MNGSLTLVSVGPGLAEHITPLAETSIKNAQVVVAYDLYLTWIKEWLPGKELITLPLTQEKARANAALEAARQGKRVVLLSSGDIGVYGMASLVFEDMSTDDSFDLSVVPGVTAATASASLLGAPLSHDFATLSLSDLLCPWDWIEERAQRIAQADLCVALYNVQSKSRQEGIYRILNIIAKHKSPGTVCGVVRNAYRDGQSVQVTTLADLMNMTFDMLTTLVIGNRHTARKGKWMFTPRGYNSWSMPDQQHSEPGQSELPDSAIWVFSGTSDGNSLAKCLIADQNDVVISTATEYGARLAAENCPGSHVIFGKTGAPVRRQRMQASNASAIVDATHPFAERMSRQLVQMASDLAVPYIRFERPAAKLSISGKVETAATPQQAAMRATQLGKRIFLATGSKDLESILSATNDRSIEWFVRLSPDPDFIQRAIAAGIRLDHIIAMQGPWSKEFNVALWRSWAIDCLVTKDSGAAGGCDTKLEAAQELQIPVIVIQRPTLDYPRVATDFESVIGYLKASGVYR